MKSLCEYGLAELLQRDLPCSCGRVHRVEAPKYISIAPGAAAQLPRALRELNIKKPFVVMGNRAGPLVGAALLERLNAGGQAHAHIYLNSPGKILPDEKQLACLEKALQPDCDFVLGIGSGVINDLCKMLAHRHGLDCGIVATAPSMDGYASDSSAMELMGVKTTVYTRCPTLLICDTDIMRKAPTEMLSAGLGDMAAKLISIADWRIAHMVTGEYYCEEIARLMLSAYERVISRAEDIMAGDEQAIREMTEGLVLSGLASSFAGVSRPASGMEHTVSHMLEMFALARGAEPALHGLQVGVGTRAALSLYERAQSFSVSGESCRLAWERHQKADWKGHLRSVLPTQAEELISLAEKDGRYKPENVHCRCKNALDNAAEIAHAVQNVCAQANRLRRALDIAGIPQIEDISALGYTPAELKNALSLSPYLRARYIFTSYCLDVGI